MCEVSLLVNVSAAQLEAVDRFQQEKGLPSRDGALALLLDIALEAVTGRGRRFWDKRIVEPQT